MRLVTWNTHHGGMRTDGRLDTAGIGLHLKAFAAYASLKVICLQEVEQRDGYGNDDKIAKWLEALGPEWSGSFVNASGVVDGSGIGNAILVRDAAQAPVLRLGLYDGRSALLVIVDGVPVVCTHLSSDHQASRVVETVQLLKWLSQNPLIVAGDFNAIPSAVEIAPWAALGFTDAWTAAAKKGTASSFLPAGATHGSSRIDYVLSKGMTVNAVTVPNLGTVGGVFPSDHHPVIVDFA